MTAYTPLDLGKITKSHQVAPPPQESLFDKFFFPFALGVLILALSFYAYKVVVEAQNTQQVEEDGQVSIPVATTTQIPSIAPSTIPEQPKLYYKIGPYTIDIQKIFDTAQEKYPNVQNRQVIEVINQDLLKFAALREYSASDEVLLKQLKINTALPIATYAALLEDVAKLASHYDRNEQPVNKKTIVELVEEYAKKTPLAK